MIRKPMAMYLRRGNKVRCPQMAASCRLCMVICLLVVMTCAKEPHRAMGRWQATEDERTLTLNLFPDGSGSFNGRKCTWQELDEYSVKTECERPILDNAVRVFTVRNNKRGELVGELESYPTVFARE